MKIRKLLLSFAVLCSGSAVGAGVDPLAAEIGMRDALRFAALMKDGALPSADALQRGYLDERARG